MTPSGRYLAPPTLALFGSLLFGGCYTEFTLADRDPADEPDGQQVCVDQPPVIVIVDFPGPTILDPSPFYPPVPVVTGPVTGSGGIENSPKRETGMIRTPPVASRPAPTPPRGGESRAPAPAAPARGGESRPAGGGSGRR